MTFDNGRHRMPVIRRMLNLSTGHLPEQICQDLAGVHGVIAHQTEYGWLMWVPTHPDKHARNYTPAIPAEVLAVQRYARSHRCDYVLFDNIADFDDQLPSWDW